MVKPGSEVRLTPALIGLLAFGLAGMLSACAEGPEPVGQASPPAQSALFVPAMSLGSSSSGNYLAGRFAQTQSDIDVASNYLLRSLAKDPENVELLQRTHLVLAEAGRLPEATVIAKRLLTFDGEAAIAALLLAEQDAKAGDWAAVETEVSTLPKRGFNTFMVPLLVAWAKVGQGKIDAALDVLEPLGQSSNFVALHEFHAALINDLADRRKAAETFYRGTLAGSGGSTVRTTEAAISFFRRTGQNELAGEFLARYRRDHPDSEMLDVVKDSRRPVDSAKAGMAEALFDAAGSLRQSRAPELALIFARMAVDLDPDFPLAQVMIADLLQGLGRLRDANAVFETITRDSSVYWSAQLRIAANFDDLDDVEAATRTLEALAEEHRDRPQALVTLGDVFRRHERWKDAISAYNRALAILSPPQREYWSIYYARGIAYERDQQWRLAEADFVEALELSPDEPHVLNYLGYSWIEQGINLDQARRMIEKAVSQLPDDGYIVDSLGWAFYRTADYGKAVELLERACELHPSDPAINDHLGDALWKVGRQEEAQFQWRRALSFTPDDALKLAIERKLDTGPVAPALSSERGTLMR